MHILHVYIIILSLYALIPSIYALIGSRIVFSTPSYDDHIVYFKARIDCVAHQCQPDSRLELELPQNMILPQRSALVTIANADGLSYLPQVFLTLSSQLETPWLFSAPVPYDISSLDSFYMFGSFTAPAGIMADPINISLTLLHGQDNAVTIILHNILFKRPSAGPSLSSFLSLGTVGDSQTSFKLRLQDINAQNISGFYLSTFIGYDYDHNDIIGCAVLTFAPWLPDPQMTLPALMYPTDDNRTFIELQSSHLISDGYSIEIHCHGAQFIPLRTEFPTVPVYIQIETVDDNKFTQSVLPILLSYQYDLVLDVFDYSASVIPPQTQPYRRGSGLSQHLLHIQDPEILLASQGFKFTLSGSTGRSLQSVRGSFTLACNVIQIPTAFPHESHVIIAHQPYYEFPFIINKDNIMFDQLHRCDETLPFYIVAVWTFEPGIDPLPPRISLFPLLIGFNDRPTQYMSRFNLANAPTVLMWASPHIQPKTAFVPIKVNNKNCERCIDFSFSYRSNMIPRPFSSSSSTTGATTTSSSQLSNMHHIDQIRQYDDGEDIIYGDDIIYGYYYDHIPTKSQHDEISQPQRSLPPGYAFHSVSSSSTTDHDTNSPSLFSLWPFNLLFSSSSSPPDTAINTSRLTDTKQTDSRLIVSAILPQMHLVFSTPLDRCKHIIYPDKASPTVGLVAVEYDCPLILRPNPQPRVPLPDTVSSVIFIRTHVVETDVYVIDGSHVYIPTHSIVPPDNDTLSIHPFIILILGIVVGSSLVAGLYCSIMMYKGKIMCYCPRRTHIVSSNYNIPGDNDNDDESLRQEQTTHLLGDDNNDEHGGDNLPNSDDDDNNTNKQPNHDDNNIHTCSTASTNNMDKQTATLPPPLSSNEHVISIS